MDEQYEAFLKALGARIRELRKKKGLSLRDMAVEHGYYESQWRKYETGGGGLNLQTVLRIAQLLEVSLSKLFEGFGTYSQESLVDIQKKKKAQAKAVKSGTGKSK